MPFRLSPIAAAALAGLLITGAAPSLAGEFTSFRSADRDDGPSRAGKHRDHRHAGGRRDFRHVGERPDRHGYDRHAHRRHGPNESFFGDGPLPDHIAGLGTFSGSISAVRDRGNGIYFYREANAGPFVLLAPPVEKGPKIITVGPEAFAAACEHTAGVCVIRP